MSLMSSRRGVQQNPLQWSEMAETVKRDTRAEVVDDFLDKVPFQLATNDTGVDQLANKLSPLNQPICRSELSERLLDPVMHDASVSIRHNQCGQIMLLVPWLFE